jgi:phosphoglycerate dehydrogenase-like enzyme
MTTITVLTPRAAEIEDALRPRLPDDVRLFAARGPEELPDEALAAEIAFGAPDQLAALVPRLPRLRWAQSTWAGITPFLEQPRRDFLLTGARGIFGAAMSEYVLGWILALERSILRHARATHWDERTDRGTAGLRVGIAGVGSIGEEVARRSAPFFREIVGLNSDGHDVPGCARCFPREQVMEFAAGLDVLVMLLPATAATKNLVDARVLGQLSRGAIVINAGRAHSLHLDDTLQALESR